MDDEAGDLEMLARLLEGWGCPADKCPLLAAQLDKRARQLAKLKDHSYQAALAHLLELMKQGWAAKNKGIS